MDVVEAIYEDGVLRVLNPSKIDSDLVTVKILNIEEVLNEDEKDLLEEALSEREKGRYHTFEEAFELVSQLSSPQKATGKLAPSIQS